MEEFTRWLISRPLEMIDILLRVNREGSKIPRAADRRPATRRDPTAPHRWVGNFRFADYQASTPFESVCGRSWAVSWEC